MSQYTRQCSACRGEYLFVIWAHWEHPVTHEQHDGYLCKQDFYFYVEG